MSILREIGRLSLLFSNKNGVGQGYFDIYNEYLEKANQLFEVIKEWHEKKQDDYNVDLGNHRYAKQGLEGKILGLAAKFNEKWQYKRVNSDAEKMIQDQQNLKSFEPEEVSMDLFTQETNLLLKDGKVYYQVP